MTPGQAAYEAWDYMNPDTPFLVWDDLGPIDRAAWEYVGMRAIAAHAEENG